MILDCYWLAEYYQVDPNTFLVKPLSEIQRHLFWTQKLIERKIEEQELARATLDG